MDFLTTINGIGTDLKLAIDDLIHQILVLKADVKELKDERAKGESND